MYQSFDKTDLGAILDGAALTIQNSWRNYQSRAKPSKPPVKPDPTIQDLDRHVKSSIQNDFLCDVELTVENETFNCHSLVLSVNSGYFRRVFSEYNRNQQDKYKFELRTSSRCWQLIQDYMYGYDIMIARKLLDTVVRIARELEITDMIASLDNLAATRSISMFSLNPNETRTIYDDDSENELVCLSPSQPVHLITNYYKFVKCVVYFYCQGKLDKTTAVHYLSFEFIDYFRMTHRQLRKCIGWFKTKLKLENSELLVQIIDLYARKE